MTLDPRTEAPTERGLEPERVPLPRLAVTLLPAGGGELEQRVIDAEVVRIGSHPGNDLALLDDLVSKFHCRLELREGRWSVRDEASRNGTFLDGVRVRDADLGVPTSELRIGRTRVRVSPLFDGDGDPSPLRSDRASEIDVAAPTVLAFGAAKRQAVIDFERHYLAGLIAATRGNVSEAARRAQVDRMHMHRLLQAHGLRGKREAP